MRYFLFLFCLLGLSGRTLAQQSYPFQWLQTDRLSQKVRALAAAPSGHIYVAGHYRDSLRTLSPTVQLPPVPPLTPAAYVACYNPQGAVEWATPLQGFDIEQWHLKTAPNGDVYLFGDNSENRGGWSTGRQAVIARIRRNGHVAWIQQDSVDIQDITPDAAGNLLRSTSIDSLTQVTLYDSTGQRRWQHVLNIYCWLGDAGAQGFYLAGSLYYRHTTLQLDGVQLLPAAPDTNSIKGALLTFDAAGNLGWVRPVITAGQILVLGLTVTPTGECTLITSIRQPSALDTIPLTAPLYPSEAVIQYDAAGHYRWSTFLPDSYHSFHVPLLVSDGAGTLYASAPVDIANHPLLAGVAYSFSSLDAALASLDSRTGARQWVQVFGTNLEDFVTSMAARPGAVFLQAEGVDGMGRTPYLFSLPPLLLQPAQPSSPYIAMLGPNSAALSTPDEAAILAPAAGLWPNPVTVGQPLRLTPLSANSTLFDALGRAVLQLPAGLTTLPTAHLSPGLYLLRSGLSTRRFIVTP